MLIKPLVRFAVNRLLKPLGVELNRAGLSEIPVNDGAYWDRYVREWKRTAAHQGLTHVGDEWENQEVFVDRLRRHASPEHTALEIGCGGGRITAVAQKLFARVHACDVFQEMLLSNASALGRDSRDPSPRGACRGNQIDLPTPSFWVRPGPFRVGSGPRIDAEPRTQGSIQSGPKDASFRSRATPTPWVTQWGVVNERTEPWTITSGAQGFP